MKKNRIIISICSRSFNNNLLILLNAISQNCIAFNLDIKVLIAFNSFKKITTYQNRLIKKKLNKINYDIIYEKRIGISYIRNKALKFLKTLKFDYCCFLDDDCKIRKNFIINHLKFIKKYKCSIVGGPQLYKSKKIFFRALERNYNPGKDISWVSTNNVLFKKSILKHNLNFSENVTKYGFGEDQLFFSQLYKLGETIKWNNNPVFEIVQKKRENYKWFLTRNYKFGLTGILIDKELHGFNHAFLLNILKASLNLTKSFLYLLLIPIKPINNFYQSSGYFFRFVGRILNFLNLYKIKINK